MKNIIPVRGETAGEVVVEADGPLRESVPLVRRRDRLESVQPPVAGVYIFHFALAKTKRKKGEMSRK